MAITGRSPREGFDVFTAHISGLVAATVTAREPLLPVEREDKMALSFRGHQQAAVPIETRFGRLHFYLGHSVQAMPADSGYRLWTTQYWYRIQHGPGWRDQAAIRWEYDRTTRRDHHAWHHAQMEASVPLGSEALDLNRAHVPTGCVTIEEVIRFLIVDFGLQPPCLDLAVMLESARLQ